MSAVAQSNRLNASTFEPPPAHAPARHPLETFSIVWQFVLLHVLALAITWLAIESRDLNRSVSDLNRSVSDVQWKRAEEIQGSVNAFLQDGKRQIDTLKGIELLRERARRGE